MTNDTAILKEQLKKSYCSDFAKNVFYFCLKKTSNAKEAEDLASDIAVCVYTELEKNHLPHSYSAWVWRIARNRYSVWADKKHIRSLSISQSAIDEHDISDSTEVDEELLQREELNLLRRELALISCEYRDIIVAYYIDDQKISVIAKNLGIPEGTVKTKLYRSRKILKEGMSMAREFGVRSYKPEEVSFSASGSQPTGLPWRAVQRKIPKNILLQAHNNPSTMEELSIELGIALPYMEEEVKLLEDATLLKRLDGGKYITNFFIADTQCQLDIYKIGRQNSKQRSELLDILITDILPEINTLNIMRNNMSRDEFKWLLIIYALDYIIENVNGYNINCTVKRNDGGNWGFMGQEKCELPEELNMGHNGNGNDSAMFWAYKISGYNLWNRAGETTYNATLLLADIIVNKRKASSLSTAELEIWKQIEGKFAHQDSEGTIIPDIAIFQKGVLKKFHIIIKNHPLYSKLLESYQNVFDDILKILRVNSTAVLLDQLNYYASMFILGTRMMMINDEVQEGRLKVPERPEESTIAMGIIIK